MDVGSPVSWRLFLAVAAIGLACAKHEPTSVRREALISDQVHGTAGTPGFFFLAPLVPDPPRVFAGAFEPRLNPIVRIDRVDKITGGTIATVARLTSETPD